jgi:hypothetical protein
LTSPAGEEFGMKDQAAIRERSDAFAKAFNAGDDAQAEARHTTPNRNSIDFRIAGL